MKHTISTRWLANPNRDRSHFRHIGLQMNIIFIIKVKILVLIKWPYMPSHPHCVAIVIMMVVIFSARIPIFFFKGVSFLYVFLKSYLTPHHIDICIRSR